MKVPQKRAIDILYQVSLGIPKAEVARRFNISRTTVWRIVNSPYMYMSNEQADQAKNRGLT